MTEPAGSQPREVRLFRSNHSQAVPIPAEFELPGDTALIRRDGDRLIIEPIRKRGILALIETWEPLNESLPGIEDESGVPENTV